MTTGQNSGVEIGQPETINEGAPLIMLDGAKDCPSIFVDGLNGVSMTAHVTKIYFVEQVPSEGKMYARHAVNLTIPNDQLLKIVDVLQQVVQSIATLQADGAQ